MDKGLPTQLENKVLVVVNWNLVVVKVVTSVTQSECTITCVDYFK
jgi:hypothetical protein